MPKDRPGDDHRPSGPDPVSVRPGNPSVPVSWGELLDKVTILEIKERRLRSPEAIANVARELVLLRAAAAPACESVSQLVRLKHELRQVNEVLWEVEDRIRAKEAARTFDAEFIELARAVYIQNDRRGSLKRQINELMRSGLFEEKQYTHYDGQGTPDWK